MYNDDIDHFSISRVNTADGNLYHRYYFCNPCVPFDFLSTNEALIGSCLTTAKQEEETNAMSLMEFIKDEVRYQAELAVRDYYFSLVRPSTVAMAAIFNALDQVDLAACQHILEALLSSQLVMPTGVSIDEDENDDSFLQELFHVKARLTCILESKECLQDEDIEDGPQLSDSSIRTLEASVRSFIDEEEQEVYNIILEADPTGGPISTTLYNIL